MADEIQNVDASGPLSTPVRRLAELIAESPAFQQWTETNSQGEALARVHHPHLRNNTNLMDVKKPVAVVSTQSFGLARVTNRQLRPDGGVLRVILSDVDRYPTRSDWSQTYFENQVGQVLSEIAALQGDDERLAIDKITLVSPPMLSRPQVAGQKQPYWVALVDVAWSRI